MENNNEVSEKERATQNNTKNIRNAADVAIASKNPYAMAAGGAVKVADKLTGGRASQKLGSAVTKLNRHSPMGNMVQNASNKLSESGASDAIGAAASMKNGAQGNNPNAALKSDAMGNNPGGSDAGQEKLKESFAKRAGNYLKNRKKKKSSTEDGSSDSGNDDNNQSTSTADNNQDDEEDKKAKVKKKKKNRILISVILALLPFIMIILVLVAFVAALAAVFGPLMGYKMPAEDGIFEKTLEEYYDKLDIVENDFKYWCCRDEAENSCLKDGGSEDTCKKAGIDSCQKDSSSFSGIDMNYIHVMLMYKRYLPNEIGNDEDLSREDYSDAISGLRGLRDTDKIFENLDCDVSYEKGGNLYNAILSSTIFGNLYKDVAERRLFENPDASETLEDEKKKILNEIFDLAESISEASKTNDDAMPEDLAIENVDENKSILVKDYLAGVIYSNVDRNVLTDSERLKAYTVIYTTNILSKNQISVNTQSISSTSLDNFNYCDPSGDCNGKGAISDIAKNTINNSIEAVYGNVLVNSNGEYDTLDISNLYDATGSDFTTILSNAYEGYTIRNAKEDVYDNGVNYGNEKVLTQVTFYEQTDYKSSFCGLKSETIATSGCGTTSMAIIASTYENNKKYDPVYMAEQARKGKYCSKGNGTYAGFFGYEAKALNYKHLSVKKTSHVTKLNIVTSHLRKGHLIVVHVGKGQFTNGGHYMVLGGIDPATKSVYVYDPYNKLNSKYKKSGSGWYKFNDILKQTKPAPTYTAFQIIWKE